MTTALPRRRGLTEQAADATVDLLCTSIEHDAQAGMVPSVDQFGVGTFMINSRAVPVSLSTRRVVIYRRGQPHRRAVMSSAWRVGLSPGVGVSFGD